MNPSDKMNPSVHQIRLGQTTLEAHSTHVHRNYHVRRTRMFSYHSETLHVPAIVDWPGVVSSQPPKCHDGEILGPT